MAARKGSLEIIALFAKLVKTPTSRIKIKLLKLIFECEEEQDTYVEAFKQQLGSISEAIFWQHLNQSSLSKGRVTLPKWINFWKHSKRPLTPPHFWKIILQMYNGYKTYFENTILIMQVVQRDVVADGNLLHFAVVNNLKEHVRILLEHGLVLSFCKSLALDKVSLYLVLVNWESEQIGERKYEIILISNQVRPKAQHASLL